MFAWVLIANSKWRQSPTCFPTIVVILSGVALGHASCVDRPPAGPPTPPARRTSHYQATRLWRMVAPWWTTIKGHCIRLEPRS